MSDNGGAVEYQNGHCQMILAQGASLEQASKREDTQRNFWLSAFLRQNRLFCFGLPISNRPQRQSIKHVIHYSSAVRQFVFWPFSG